MIFQALAPSTEVFAQELDAVMEASVSAARAAGNTARAVQDAVATALEDADQAASDGTVTTPGATEGGDGSTNADGSQDSTTDGTANGDASTEGDTSQGDTTADDSAADEEQADDADADAAAQANVTYKYNTVDDLKAAIGDANVTVDADKVIGVTIGTSEDLIKLSNTDPAIYQNAAITKGGATGSGLNLCSAVMVADGVALSFLGFGAPNAPFKGSFGSGISPIVLNRPLFNNVELSTDMTLALTWEGATSDPIVATTIAGGGHKLSVDLTVAPAADNTTAVTLTSPLLGSVSDVLTLDTTYAAKGDATPAVNIKSETDNVGLLANTLADGAALSIEKVTLPSAYSGNPTIQTTKDGASAGGLIGVCGNGATVSISGNVDLSAFSVIGKAASGGLIGKAAKLTLNIANDATIKPAARNVGNENSACSGGVIGDVSFAQGFTVKPNMFDLGDGVTLGATQCAGALFGVADISTGDVVVKGGTYKSKLASGADGSTSGSYGGLIGKVFATAKGEDESLRALVVQKGPDQQDTDKNKCTIEFNLASELSDAGGVVGYVGDNALPNSQPVAVVLNGVTVTCKGDASARTDAGELGGAVGVVDARSVLDVRDFTLASDNAIGGTSKNRAAGIAGSARNAVIKFSGIADLSGARFAENGTMGQLVFENNNALIFAVGDGSDGELTDKGATGWTFKRSNTASKTDDIATYGEVIRLGGGLSKNFITLDPNTHVLTLPTLLESANSAYTLTSVEDFAKLAITWQTNGYYPMVAGVSDNNLNGLQSSTITVSDKIDLAGTGLTGFTQDRAGDSQVFSGTLNGNGTIKLVVGESYGMRGEAKLGESDTSKGNGKIYRHGRPGLFAAVNGASISNVTIAGSMKFDNGSVIDAGALAGAISGSNDKKLTLSGVTCETNITCDDTFGNDVNIGGIAGSVTADATVDFNNSTKAKATIATGKTLNGNTRIGGAIGYVGNHVSTFNVTGLEVGGKIETGECASGKIAQVGGFIGCIAQSTYANDGKIASSALKNVNISGLSFNSFEMIVGKNGDRRNGAGGLLGYSWGNTTVNMEGGSADRYALTSEGSSVAADVASEVGGLVYAASGHWIINNYAINLNGAAFSASAATAFGVLIARASKTENKDAQKYGTEVYTGLYLEDRAYWGEAYRVEEASIGISDNQLKAFDEWIAYGVNPIRKLIDGDWNAVVSLHTETPELDMSGDPSGDNGYKNRTRVGQKQKYASNGNTRYYYNLDRAWTAVKDLSQTKKSDGWMDRPEYLLLWCARLYAPLEVRNYIAPADAAIFDRNNIGSSSGDSIATIDLTGYSFYPTNISNRDVQIKNVKITLCYSKIKSEQKNNKVNNSATQHENMHCGLIRTIGNKNLTVENVTLSGTVGRAANDKESSTDPESVSGALLLRCAYGASGDKKATIKIDALTLDGLQVDGAEDKQYAPLLINAITRYVNLDVKNVATSNYADAYGTNKTAASSLFGRLGYNANSDQVTAKFEQISLPSQKSNTIFTHASLLESFGYTTTGTGSADYTFTKADADAGKVTYGSEIDAKGEYSGKQLWYYDETTYGTDSGLVTVDNKPANAENPRFGDYLPYVYKGKATKDGVQYHEIKVNQRIPNLMTGCGTYGDPYTVKDATEMNAIANYINNGTALDGWEVTIAADQSKLCERRSNETKTDNEVVYVYKKSNEDGKKWEKKNGKTTDPTQTLTDETMRRYVQSAYYSIEPAKDNKITLDAASFGGFGNKANPFRGVIVGDLESSGRATIEIENNEGGLRGLIPYSYGSVVRNLNIRYVNAQATITYSTKDTDGVPTAFFGGAIGCILGGDNIIDGVVVNGTTDNPATGFTVAGGGTKPHLVPIGGYVGAIAGGGVIFRNMNENEHSSWRAGTSDKSRGLGKGNFDLYDNPYVGRVIDGYAFSEGEDCTVDNGDANYKINKLENIGMSCVTATAASDNTTVRITPTSAQGLLVLSAIINSGAASGGVSLAYEGGTYDTKTSYRFGNARYGKVRNAAYEHVGNPASAADDFNDFKRSIADDQTAPGFTADGLNLPYLVNSYADAATGSLCASLGVELQLASNEPYNMTSYGRGFTGLSGRYVSNACASSKGVDRDCIVPRIACINGNGETIKVGSKKDNKVYGVTEYADDDYKVAGVGALFSTVSFTSSNVSDSTADGMVKNLKFVDCDVELTIKDANGAGQAGNEVGVGLLAGVTANNDGSVSGVYRNVTMDGCKVAGAKNVGGLLGSSGYCSRAKATTSTSEIIEKARMASPVKLYDCSYTNMDVTGGCNVGGYVGKVGMYSGCGIWETGKNPEAVASDSNVKATGADGLAVCVGGIFGWTQWNISVNTTAGKNAVETSGVATIANVTVESPSPNQGLSGAGGFVGRADYGKNSIYNLSITATEDKRYIGSSAVDSSKLNNVGGCIGYIISGNGSSYWFDSCTFNGLHIAAKGIYTGGLIGNFTSNDPVSCNNITVDGLKFDGQCAGGLFGLVDRVINVNVTNSKIASSAFLQVSSGCITGVSRGKYYLANVLLDGNTFNNKDQQGILVGSVDVSKLDGYELCAAGLSVKLAEGQTNATMPALIRASDNSKIGEVNNKSYVAFGDYNDMLTVPDKALYNADAADSTTAAVAPYVTTSPVPENALSVKTAADETGQTRYLFGDGVNVSGASTIKTDAEKGGSKHYVYTNFDGENHWNYSPSSGEFNANNDTDATKTDANPDVLVLSGNDSDTVKDYLNIITNGGYSDALRLNADGSHVSATVDVFQLDENGAFVKTDVDDKALDVKGSGSSLSIGANSNWDNGKGRFNLLTVTFTEAGQSYRVMVPIIVKRVLEINFTATYSEGSNFNSDDYSTKYDKHVLISSGETMTGYLAWAYNKAYDKETEYGWNTHLASGGDMRPLKKRIEFGGAKGALPAGTQLTLVDTAHNSKEYQYTVPAGGSCASVALTDFKDSSGSNYTEQWLSETMGAVASVPEDGSGSWVKLTDKELTDEKNAKKTEAELISIAGAKIGNDYYRVKTDADTEGPFYSLTVPKKEAGEQPKSESFYLVVRTPKGSTNVNGYTGTSVTTSVNTHLNYTLREDGKKDSQDSHENTASTYSVATNFQHNLVDNKTSPDGNTSINQMAVIETTYPLDMDVSDTITFGEQEYTSSDALYYQLDSSLVNYEGGNAAGAHGYPTGTRGTYSFYVKVGDNYFAWDGSKWNDAGTTETPAVGAGHWSSTTGGDMSLVLADTKGAIDLSGIREIAKEHGSRFTITMRANLTMTELACQAGIIASQNNGNDKYTKPNYRAYLSTHAETLSTSSNSAYNDGGAGYYRTNVGSSTIALEASKRSQLGINIDDLKSADGTIALVGTYDFSKLAGADAMISNATKVTYTLTLQRRSEIDGSYVDVTDDISKYVRVTESRLAAVKVEGNAITFTDVKKDDAFGTQSGDTTFSLLFIVEVNTNVEKAKQTYANYRLVLTAQMSGGGVDDRPVNVSNLDGYPHSDYVTYTLARINTEGIPHETQAN